MNDLLSQFLTNSVKDAFAAKAAEKVGADKAQTSDLMEDAFSFLVGGMAKNTQDSNGAESLLNALDKKHDGSILDHPEEAIEKEEEGAKSLTHILGGKTDGAVQALAQKSGVSTDVAKKMLAMAAPLVLGALGKAKSSNGIGLDDIGGVLSAFSGKEKGMGSLVSNFLDQDGDGSIVDDLFKMGKKFM